MTTNDIINQIAKQHNTTPELVRMEMEQALREASQSNDPTVKARWAKIPRKGKEITLEEFLRYISGITKK